MCLGVTAYITYAPANRRADNAQIQGIAASTDVDQRKRENADSSRGVVAKLRTAVKTSKRNSTTAARNCANADVILVRLQSSSEPTTMHNNSTPGMYQSNTCPTAIRVVSV
jgi:hypothetical protein